MTNPTSGDEVKHTSGPGGPEKATPKAKHTPGPWTQWSGHSNVFAGKVDENLDYSIKGKDIRQVCSCDCEDIPDDEQSANARLIAAAPDMLAACELQEAWWQFCTKETITDQEEGEFRKRWDVPENVHSDEWVKMVRRAAIAKAVQS